MTEEMNREPQLDGVEEDDPAVPDTDEDEDEDLPMGDLFADDAGAGDGDGEDGSHEGRADGDQDPEEGVDEESASSEHHGDDADQENRHDRVVLTQQELDRIIEQRLGRDRKARTVRELESLIGKPLEDFIEDVRQEQIRQVADRYGMTEQEAKEFLEQQAQLREFQRRQKELEEQQRMIEAKIQYVEEKRQALSDPRAGSLIRRFEMDIDQIAEQNNVPFSVAARYVLGDKLLSGELGAQLEEAARQRVLRASKDTAAAPVSGKSGGASLPSLSPVERALAKALGVDPREWAEEKAKMRRRR